MKTAVNLLDKGFLELYDEHCMGKEISVIRDVFWISKYFFANGKPPKLLRRLLLMN
jgi:hypothetical protein